MSAPKLIPFAGDDRPAPLKAIRLTAATLFRQGMDTREIAIAKDMTEQAVLKRVTLERCRRLGLPNPYEAKD